MFTVDWWGREASEGTFWSCQLSTASCNICWRDRFAYVSGMLDSDLWINWRHEVVMIGLALCFLYQVLGKEVLSSIQLMLISWYFKSAWIIAFRRMKWSHKNDLLLSFSFFFSYLTKMLITMTLVSYREVSFILGIVDAIKYTIIFNLMKFWPPVKMVIMQLFHFLLCCLLMRKLFC